MESASQESESITPIALESVESAVRSVMESGRTDRVKISNKEIPELLSVFMGNEAVDAWLQRIEIIRQTRTRQRPVLCQTCHNQYVV